MASKIFKILAASIVLGAVLCAGTELSVARGGGGGGAGHGGGGGAHFSGGGAHFSGGGAHFSGGGAHFSGAGARFSGAGAHFSGARFSGAHVRGLSGARMGISRGNFANFRGAHIRSGAHISSLSGAHIRSLSGAHIRSVSGAHIRSLSGAGTLAGHTAWNQWGHHWNGSHHWHGGWGGPIYWPYFYGDLFAFTFWPWDYYDPFWTYEDNFIWDALFWPGPDYPYETGYFDIDGNYAYSGAARTRLARRSNGDREITGSTTKSNDLTQTCSGVAPGVTDIPFDYIEQTIKPTEEQLKALAALKVASSQGSDALRASCSSEVMLTPLGRLDALQKRLDDGMIQALGIVRTPLDNFYNSLSEEQKLRFSRLGSASDGRITRRGNSSGNDPAALCSRRPEGFAQPPVERVEQVVKPTQEQRDVFARLKLASTEGVNLLQASCPTQTPQTPIDRFDALAKRLDATSKAIKIVRPELANFYASLTDEQKARFNLLGPPQTTAPRKG
jgi:LTXXQ motif family protein